MACKIVHGPGFTAIQCSTDQLGGPSLDALVRQQEKGSKRPYGDGECRHDETFANRGVLTCIRCAATYNEDLLQWENFLE